MIIRDNLIIMDNFCSFCVKTYVVIPHMNRLIETVQMKGHNIMVSMSNKKNYPSIINKYPLLSRDLQLYQQASAKRATGHLKMPQY